MNFTHSFKHTLPFVSMRTAYGADTDKAENVEMDTEVCVTPEHRDGGWYETYDLETGGDRFYAEGVLEVNFDGDKATLVGYDGCYELPDYITQALEEKGVIIDL
tara:strand:- start:1531 stop:1842 length:312 start_codon:yes stop_codon:yes gene_type:complete